MRAYNSALAYAKRKTPEFAEYMPDTVSFKELRSSIKLGKELNRIVNKLRRGGKASAFKIAVSPSGTMLTEWELHEAQINYRTEESRKARERKARGLRPNSPEALQRLLSPNPLKPEQMTRSQMRRLDERVRRESATTPTMKAASYYANYMDGLRNVGMEQAFPGDFARVSEIVREIMEKDPDFLIEVFMDNVEELQIEWVYDDLQELEVRMRYIRNGWETVWRDWNSRRS